MDQIERDIDRLIRITNIRGVAAVGLAITLIPAYLIFLFYFMDVIQNFVYLYLRG